MSSRPGRKYHNWFATPLDRLGLTLLALIYPRTAGMRGLDRERRTVQLFYRLLPQFERLSDKAVWGRSFTLNLPSKIGEHPGLQPELMRYTALATLLLDRGEPLPVEELAHELAGLNDVTPPRDERRDFTDAELREALKRQNGQCRGCRAPLGEDNPPVGDHMLPYSLGGPTIAANCDALCVSCNERKRNLHPIDFGRQLGLQAARGRIGVHS